MPMALLLKYVLPAVVVVAVLGSIAVYLDHRGYSRAETKYKLVIAQEKAARDEIVAKHKVEVANSERDMEQARQSRVALASDLAQRITANDGLAARLRDAQARLRAGAVPQASGDTSPTAKVVGDACDAGQLEQTLQRHIDACRSDAIALSALASRKVCECP